MASVSGESSVTLSTPSPSIASDRARAVKVTVKRSRIVGSQSRNGCYTCKSRRIKCDETRPTCTRCERSRRPCEGYRDDPYTEQVAVCATKTEAGRHQRATLITLCPGVESTPLHPINPSCRLSYDGKSQRLIDLACMTLQYGASRDLDYCNEAWRTLVPQLSCTATVVSCALAAFGAALESSRIFEVSRVPTKVTAVEHYGTAIRVIQKELGAPPQALEPLLLSCVLLACADLLLWRESNAHKHLLGTLQLLSRRWRLRSFENTSVKHDTIQIAENCQKDPFQPRDDLDLLFIQMDMQTASYALGIPPQLPAIDMQYLLAVPRSQRRQSDLELEVTQVIHASYHAAHLASQYKYRPPDSLPPDAAFRQARQVAELTVQHRKLGRLLSHKKLSTAGIDSTPPSRKLGLVLRMQCLAVLVYLSMTTNRCECGYDAYVSSFQQIVADAAELNESKGGNASAFGDFTIGIGILQPLLLTAVKCRDPVLRRQAISLLEQGGREGPFHGRLLSAVASRVVDIEESSSTAKNRPANVANDIPEANRIHGTGMDVDALANGGPASIDATFSRCSRLDFVTNAGRLWEDRARWDIWTESISFHS